jgi:hypothetical protein
MGRDFPEGTSAWQHLSRTHKKRNKGKKVKKKREIVVWAG